MACFNYFISAKLIASYCSLNQLLIAKVQINFSEALPNKIIKILYLKCKKLKDFLWLIVQIIQFSTNLKLGTLCSLQHCNVSQSLEIILKLCPLFKCLNVKVPTH